MKINKNIFRAYDIRGIADPPTDLSEESIYLIGKGAGTYMQEVYDTKTMAVGADNRLTSPKLKAAYIKGLMETGIDVTDVGLTTSPMIYWSVCALEFDAGTNITASHNPKEYNGIKIVSKNAHSICGEELQDILKIIEQQQQTVAKAEVHASKTKQGTIQTQNLWPQYLEDLIKRIHPQRKLKIVVDAGNGTTSNFAPELLKKLDCEVVPLFCKLDGTFPNHEANPEDEKNMEDLKRTVLKEKADLGIGFDGDGDRIGIVDEKGKHYSADFLLYLLTKDLLTRQKKPQIVFDIKVSQAIINQMKALGAVPVMSKTGHSFIESKMKEIGAPLGGEVSGHMFFAENYYGFDDAFLAAGKIIEILSKETHPFSQLFNELPKTFTTPELRLPTSDDKKFEIVDRLVAHFTDKYECITIDGVRVHFDDNSWGAVRCSNTSPNLTLRFEADSEERLNEIKQIFIEQLKTFPEVDISPLTGS
ncbi:MAG: phosphomannomutase/phosphoglucomutase [Candidatus Peregrinibacteria bacterium]